MGENQGMVWIILGVIVVGTIIMTLGATMKGGVEGVNKKAGDDIASQNLPTT